ncbi:MAG: transposase [Opitutales bacterium]|nr:transposase [Opitutales bacterium]
MSSLPERKILPHEVPSWVNAGETFFITICCKPRGKNQLCVPSVRSAIWETNHHLQIHHAWYCRLMLLMPDHLHAMLTFPHDRPMKRVIRNFKSFIARNTNVVWQSGFFDHRLRSQEHQNETWHYIMSNPVRQNLCPPEHDWEYVWKPQ